MTNPRFPGWRDDDDQNYERPTACGGRAVVRENAGYEWGYQVFDPDGNLTAGRFSGGLDLFSAIRAADAAADGRPVEVARWAP